MATKQEWLDWIKAKRREQADLLAQIRAMEEGGLRIGHHRHDQTGREISLLKQQIEGIEKVVQDVIVTEGLPSDA